jgi:hypothetical protein
MPAPLAFRTVAILALIAFAIGCVAAAAQAQAPIATPTVVATGFAAADVTPLHRTVNASIAAAVERAEAKALPEAIADAKANAAALATAAGVALGPLLSVSNTPASPYFGPFYGVQGTFGPGQYCGTVRTTVFKTGKDGKRHRVGTRSRRSCRVPRSVSQSVELTFAQTPPAA